MEKAGGTNLGSICTRANMYVGHWIWSKVVGGEREGARWLES